MSFLLVVEINTVNIEFNKVQMIVSIHNLLFSSLRLNLKLSFFCCWVLKQTWTLFLVLAHFIICFPSWETMWHGFYQVSVHKCVQRWRVSEQRLLGQSKNNRLLIVERTNSGALACKACNGAPWVRKWSNLPIQENLVITWPYAHLAGRLSPTQAYQCKITQSTG